MASYETKFSVGETAYIVNERTIVVVPLIITGIYIVHSLPGPMTVEYRCSGDRSTGNMGPMYKDEDLMYLPEAKLKAEALLAERAASFRGMN